MKWMDRLFITFFFFAIARGRGEITDYFHFLSSPVALYIGVASLFAIWQIMAMIVDSN